MSIKMDFTTTATARPDIVDTTYASFSKNLMGIDLKDCRLFINIDPLPNVIDRKEVTRVAEKYFGEVCTNYPTKPNYTAAYNWVWANAKTEYIFNLEDDWVLTRKVSVPYLLEYFQQHRELLEVGLRAYSYNYSKCPTSPSIMHRRYYSAVGGNLDEGVNPEIRLRGKKFGIEMPTNFENPTISTKGKLIIYPEDRSEIILKDIGRDWIEKSEFKKFAGNKEDFVTWGLKQ